MLLLVGIYCALIVAASLIGGWLANVVALTHTRMQLIVSAVGGLMLGITVFHLLPHSIEETGSVGVSMRWLLFGLLGMFFLIRTFDFHHHGPAKPAAEHQHEHDHSHDHGHHHHSSKHPLSWFGVALGLGVHTLIDGLALGASVETDSTNSATLLPGLGTFLAVLLHKPLDAISITLLMAAGGWPAGARNAINAGFALMCPLGAVLFVLGVGRLAADQHDVVGAALGFSAGVFLCISLGDLLPEVEFHSHDRIKLSLALLLGIAVAWLIEMPHAHPHG
ncbi:MAG: ZIP family metal transporter [Planctomycetaceae bacterium]